MSNNEKLTLQFMFVNKVILVDEQYVDSLALAGRFA